MPEDTPEDQEARDQVVVKNWVTRHWKILVLVGAFMTGGVPGIRSIMDHGLFTAPDIRENLDKDSLKSELALQLRPLLDDVAELKRRQAETDKNLAFLEGRLSAAVAGKTLAMRTPR